MTAKEAMQVDIRHFYLEKGRGAPLILLHGNGESSDYFRGQIDVFAERYHVYAPDTRGHGRTPRGVSPFTIRQFAEDAVVKEMSQAAFELFDEKDCSPETYVENLMKIYEEGSRE